MDSFTPFIRYASVGLFALGFVASVALLVYGTVLRADSPPSPGALRIWRKGLERLPVYPRHSTFAPASIDEAALAMRRVSGQVQILGGLGGLGGSLVATTIVLVVGPRLFDSLPFMLTPACLFTVGTVGGFIASNALSDARPELGSRLQLVASTFSLSRPQAVAALGAVLVPSSLVSLTYVSITAARQVGWLSLLPRDPLESGDPFWSLAHAHPWLFWILPLLCAVLTLLQLLILYRFKFVPIVTIADPVLAQVVSSYWRSQRLSQMCPYSILICGTISSQLPLLLTANSIWVNVAVVVVAVIGYLGLFPLILVMALISSGGTRRLHNARAVGG